MNANTTFTRLFNTAQEVEFNPAWANGTGYYDYAVEGDKAPALQAGDVRKCMDNKGRRMVIICRTPGKNIVIFDRFSNSSPDGVLVSNLYYGEEVNLLKSGLDFTSQVLEPAMYNLCQTLGLSLDIQTDIN